MIPGVWGEFGIDEYVNIDVKVLTRCVVRLVGRCGELCADWNSRFVVAASVDRNWGNPGEEMGINDCKGDTPYKERP